MYPENLGKNIKRLRLLAGESQTEFAARLGVCQTTLSGYETGKFLPPLSVLIRLHRDFQVSYDWLLPD